MPRERISTRSNIPISVSTSNPKFASKKSLSENLNQEVNSKPTSKTHSRKVQPVVEGAAGERRHLSVVDFNATYTTVSSVGNNSSIDKTDVFYNDPNSGGGFDEQHGKRGKTAKAPTRKSQKLRNPRASERMGSASFVCSECAALTRWLR